MNKLPSMLHIFKRFRLHQIVTSLLLTGILLFSTAFNSQAIAAANRSNTSYPTNDKNVKGLLYSDSDRVESLDNVNDFVSPQEQKELLDATQIPAKKQPILDRSDPNAKLLEKTVQMFEDAGDFSAN